MAIYKGENIIIDGEVTSYQPNKNAGPFYYTYKEFKAMHYLHDEAERLGFNVISSLGISSIPSKSAVSFPYKD